MNAHANTNGYLIVGRVQVQQRLALVARELFDMHCRLKHVEPRETHEHLLELAAEMAELQDVVR